MSKRNFILLIIVLVLGVAVVSGFLYLRKDATTPGENIEGTNFISQFNPFGTKPKPPVVTPPIDVSNNEPIDEEDTRQAKLMKISSVPVAGFTVFSKERLKDIPLVSPSPVPGETVPVANNTKKPVKKSPPPTEFMPALRYVDRITGNIYQTFVDKIEERRFSTTLIPKVYEAYFGNRGGAVVMRYLKQDGRTIETFFSTLPKEELGGDTVGNNEIKGSFLPNNIKDVSLSPDNTKLFYLFENGDNMVGTILNLSNNKKTQVFDSPFTEWLSSWPSANMITLSTKPSAGIPGYTYTIDGVGKNLTKVLGDIRGLTSLMSPSGKLILNGDNNLSLYMYHTDTRNSEVLSIKTLPEKCVWSKTGDSIYCGVPKFIPSAEYPDSWYQGEVSFSDQIWKIDVKTGNGTLLLDPTSAPEGEEIDGIKLALDENENSLFFVNKKDSFLWKLDLK